MFGHTRRHFKDGLRWPSSMLRISNAEQGHEHVGKVLLHTHRQDLLVLSDPIWSNNDTHDLVYCSRVAICAASTTRGSGRVDWRCCSCCCERLLSSNTHHFRLVVGGLICNKWAWRQAALLPPLVSTRRRAEGGAAVVVVPSTDTQTFPSSHEHVKNAKSAIQTVGSGDGGSHYAALRELRPVK